MENENEKKPRAPRTEEHRRHLSEALKGKPASDAQKEAASKAHTGKYVSPETRKKISEKAKGHKRNLGRTHSEETKDRMRLAKHKTFHVERDIVKEGCKFCDQTI